MLDRVIIPAKKWKDRILSPVSEFLLSFGFHASFASFVGLVFGLLSVFFLFDNNFLGLCFYLLHVVFDILDGSLARVSGRGSWIVDFFVDRAVTLAIILKVGFAFDFFVPLILLFFVVNFLALYFQNKVWALRVDVLMGVFVFLGFVQMGMYLMFFSLVLSAVLLFVCCFSSACRRVFRRGAVR